MKMIKFQVSEKFKSVFALTDAERKIERQIKAANNARDLELIARELDRLSRKGFLSKWQVSTLNLALKSRISALKHRTNGRIAGLEWNAARRR